VNKKSPLSAFLTAILIAGLILASAMRFSTVQAATEVTGIINSDTKWTKANSPYNLTSSITVASGVTLTIEPGTIVQLNEHCLQINGTLIARGTSSDPINFYGGAPISTGTRITTEDYDYSIVFSPSSTKWSQQTQSGSIIENAVIGNLVINGGSPKVINNFLGNIDIMGGNPEISNNNVVGGIGVYAGSALIANNTVSQQNHYFLGYGEGRAIITQRYERNNNVIIITQKATPFVVNNVIIGKISQAEGGIGFETQNATIINNTIYGCVVGIGFYEGIGNAVISDNIIYDSKYGINLNNTLLRDSEIAISITIQRNIIRNNTYGIVLTLPAIIENNTIGNNTVGIATSAPLSATYNNIEGNNQSVYISSPNSLNATNNWWGTTDTQAISQSIHDFDDDSTLGKVTFVPFLTEPNPAIASGQSVTPTPTPTPTPSEEPQQTEQIEPILSAAIAGAVIIAILGLLIYLTKRK